MNVAFSIILICLASTCFGQTRQPPEAVYNIKIAYRPASVQLLSDTHRLPAFIVNNTPAITYKNLSPGKYKLRISGNGQASKDIDSIIVKDGELLVLNFNVDGPCLYDRPAGYVPVCPKDHGDNIVPIVYGLVVTQVRRDGKETKELNVKYGGCVVTGCDPGYYCRLHGIEF